MSRLRTLSTNVTWVPWSANAFVRAREERKPVLLSITAEWCAWCREMDGSSFADPSAATTINERFVPVRVDADARPDIAERYGLGGWPTTAFLSASGALLGGGTFISPARLCDVLARVLDADAWSTSSADAEPAAPPDATARPLDAAALCEAVFASFDAAHGGVGGAPKFPHTAPILLALSGHESGERVEQEALAIHALDAMGWHALFDEEHGGFFHYAAGADWTAPHTAKRLDANADLIRLYLTAGAVLGHPRYTARAADALRYVQTWLADPVDGGWYAAQHAADAFYAADPKARAAMAPPPVSQRMYANAVAAMVSAALHAADVFDDDGLRQFALTSLERVLLACYKPGDGVAHYHDGHRRCRGLLADQVAMAGACLDAHEASGNVVYSMMAEELMHFAVRTLWDHAHGGFFDRPDDEDDPDAVGLLRRRLRPFVENCTAAGVLARAAAVSGDHDFSRYAADTLAAMAPLAAAQGPLAAHYLLALRAGR